MKNRTSAISSFSNVINTTYLLYFNRHKKPVAAWLLLLLLTVQQVVGRAYVTVHSTVEIEVFMTDTEAFIANEIHENIGLDARVEIYDKTQVEHLLSLGYGTPFMAAALLEGDTAYFALQQDRIETHSLTRVFQAPQGKEIPVPHQTTLEKWFPDFCFSSTMMQVLPAASAHKELISTSSSGTVSCRMIPSPPPEMA